MPRVSGQTWFLAAVVAASCGVVGYLAVVEANQRRSPPPAASRRLELRDIPFDGRQAYEYLRQLCRFGSRVSGSPGMQAQREMLTAFFEKQGAKVTQQRFRARNPADGTPVDMANLIIEWQPNARQRILVAAHYDTRPFPDQDRENPRGLFVGANDGASGVALLMALGPAVKALDGEYGVDFVLFDGEELVYNERDAYFLGSTHFATEYATTPPGHTYRVGVVLDMIGDGELQLYQEGNSVDWPPSREVANSIWTTARRLGVREFVARRGHTVNDDHLPLCRIAKIPTCDVIDFDYPAWHTQADTPDRCSPLSLAKVGWVIEEWLKATVR